MDSGHGGLTVGPAGALASREDAQSSYVGEQGGTGVSARRGITVPDQDWS
jgi:hypothetical protein